MLRFNYLVIAIFVIAYIPIFRKLLKKKSIIEQHLLYIASYVYMGGALDQLFFPIPVLPEDLALARMWREGVEYNLIPFKSILVAILDNSIGFAIRQVGGNILLFMPLGYFLPLLKHKINTVKKILITSFGISMAIEIVQLTASILYRFTYRYADVDDLLLNTLGALIGFGILKLTVPIIKYLTRIDVSHLIRR